MIYKISAFNVHLWTLEGFRKEVRAETIGYTRDNRGNVDYILYETNREIPKRIFKKYGLKGTLEKGS